VWERLDNSSMLFEVKEQTVMVLVVGDTLRGRRKRRRKSWTTD
jgi:hypothetical protein